MPYPNNIPADFAQWADKQAFRDQAPRNLPRHHHYKRQPEDSRVSTKKVS